MGPFGLFIVACSLLPSDEKERSQATQSENARQLEAEDDTSVLFDLGQGTHVQFQRLIVLAFDLELGLEFLDQQLEMSNLRAQFVNFWDRWNGTRRGRCGRARNLAERRLRLGMKGLSERARPGGICRPRFGQR